MNDIKIYASPLPFSNAQISKTAPPGSTIQDIVDGIVPEYMHECGIGATAQVNGWIVPREYWASIKPNQGTIVNIRVIPQGGGGKKNPLATLLSIAVMIAAPALSTAILGQTLAATQIGIGTITYGKILSVAIGAVGKLLISALAPPPKPSNFGAGNISNPSESPTQFIEGARNALTPFAVVPICLGTNRMFPLQAARPFTETVNNDQFVRQLFTYGWGDEMEISDLKIGESVIEDFVEFDMEHLLNGDLHTGSGIYSNDVFQENLSVTLNSVDGFTTRTTKPDIDEAVVDITFPRGLAKFDSQGKRGSYRVQLEVQYALTGESPLDFSPATSVFKAFSGAVVNFAPVQIEIAEDTGEQIFCRTDLIVIDNYSGVISVVRGPRNGQAPTIPRNAVRIASVDVDSFRDEDTGVVSTDITVNDVRDPALFGVVFEDSSSFVPSKTTSLSATVTSGSLSVNDLDILGNQTEALRKSVSIKFPVNGQYDIRIRKVTTDSSSDQIFDDVQLTAIKSIKYAPPVLLVGINGTAMVIKATDQLNGALDQFNVVASNLILDYDVLLDDWIRRPTSNPASIYRYVLQAPANAKALADSKINLTDLEAWHAHCLDQEYSYNRVIDFETSVAETLRDVSAAGAASPAIVDGLRTIVIDKIKTDIVQIVTPRNSWGYTGEKVYNEIPHAFRVQFRNKAKGYIQDERIVYDDGFDETNATEFEALELQSCTNADLAFKTGRRHIASIRLRPETHTFMMDVENLVALRGDRIKLEHDAPIIGVGDGRIKTIQLSGDSPETVTGFTIDDTVNIPNSNMFFVRIRLADGTQLYRELITAIGDTSTFVFETPVAIVDTPAVGDLCYFVEAGGEVDLIITRIEPQDDLTARITAIDYAPEVQDAENAPIPAFNSHITIPLEFIRPVPPLLLDEQSDEDVMLINSDGSFITRAIFTLENRNEGGIQTSVKIRVSGTTVFTNANVLESTPEKLVITGLQDGTRYDVHIRYRRENSTMFSAPLELNNYLYVGTSGPPDDVSTFQITVTNDLALLKWSSNDDIDLSHYEVRYTNAFSGALWETAQVLEANIEGNRVTVPFLGGTYLIKAVDLSGNDSVNATAIITYDPGLVENAVETLVEDPTFTGAKDNVAVQDSALILIDTTLTDGFYNFATGINLTGVFSAFVSAEVIANGIFVNNLFIEPDIFALVDMFGAGGNDLFAEADLFALDDIFGIASDGWEIELQFRTTQTDPGGSPVVFTDWAPLVAGTIEFFAIEFRIKLTSLQTNVSPNVTSLSVRVDMPDRIERGNDLTVPVGGATVTFNPIFQTAPSVGITIQDGATDDRIDFSSKTASGFSFKVHNDTVGGFVARTYDYIVSGFGRNNP